MKKLTSIILSIILISLVACSTGTSTAKVEIMPEGTELSGVLHLSSMLDESEYSGWAPLVKGFTELHPNVEIITQTSGITGFETAEEIILTQEQYVEQLKVKFVSGDVPDILFEPKDLFSELVPSGVFMDLNEFIESDETFIKEDYFMNVIEAVEIGGKLYRMPSTFNTTFYRFNTDILKAAGISEEEITSVDYKFVMDTFNKAVESGEVPDLQYVDKEGYAGKTLFRAAEYEACFDMDSMSANFDTENFRNYLSVMNDYNNSPTPDGIFYATEEGVLLSDNTYFMEEMLMRILGDNISYLTMEKENATRAYPSMASNGDYFVATSPNLSIPTSAKNPELAWEFIKYCIYESEKVTTYTDYENVGKWNGDRFNLNIPINKNNAKKYAEASMLGFSQETADEFNGYLEFIETLPFTVSQRFQGLFDANNEIIEDYLDGLMSLDECIEELGNRTNIYFGEVS